MTQKDIIQRTAEYIKQEFSDDPSGHDWWHIYRVWKNAAAICRQEKADAFIVELAALLHDLDDWKFNENGDETPHRAKAWMNQCGVDSQVNEQVCEIIMHISYKGARVENKMKSLEGFIVQDADRLDAIGAIGIGRAFAYGGYRNRPMYDPESSNQMHASFEEYKNSKSATINHFYEKLLLLRDRMNTPAAKRMAEGRHEVMLRFLDQFMSEWEGRDTGDGYLTSSNTSEVSDS
ncbi:MAG: HD domain-containing protein [Chloroflexi bacterium]|nr:HD domain-containing protein [Chloroflexota bacterium]